MIEEQKYGALVELDVDLPELLVIPHERIVDLDVQLESFDVEKLLEGQVGGSLDRVEDAIDGGLVAILFGKPWNAAYKRRVCFAFKSLKKKKEVTNGQVVSCQKTSGQWSPLSLPISFRR